jgi:hypothetical protein
MVGLAADDNKGGDNVVAAPLSRYEADAIRTGGAAATTSASFLGCGCQW